MIIQCDASQLEWRVSLELSGDETGLQEVLNGADTHDLNRVAFSLPSRLISKIYLFRTIFRGSGWSFANDPDFMHVSTSPKYWDDVNEKFYSKYSGLDRCHKQWANLVVNGKPIQGPLGRYWPISMGRGNNGELKIPWTVLTNYPVQGTGADVMMIARISFANRLRKLEESG
jgi:DNA polymerase I-like protein with 3'-5' exonuclease and polymerase domains